MKHDEDDSEEVKARPWRKEKADTLEQEVASPSAPQQTDGRGTQGVRVKLATGGAFEIAGAAYLA